jgi:DnaK suppressor protein
MAVKKNASLFSQKFLNEIEANLVAEQKRLEQELNSFAKKNSHVADDFDASYPEYGDKSDDNAQEVERYTVNKPLEITLEKTLRDIKVALKRIKDGTYGTCKYCKQPIEEKRLLARPTSSACVSCKKTLTNEI